MSEESVTNIVPFYSGVFSNWHPCSFVIDEQVWTSSEQYYMYMKAVVFDDKETQKRIRETKSCKEQKQLGRMVKGYNEIVWKKHREEVMLRALRAKFSQSSVLKEKLLKTGNAILVEASPVDLVWGVGLSEDNVNIHDQSKWRGMNLLGKCLMIVRSELAN